MKLTAKKISEKWIITDGDNKIEITVRPDFTFDVFRHRVKEESFIKEALQVITEKIEP